MKRGASAPLEVYAFAMMKAQKYFCMTFRIVAAQLSDSNTYRCLASNNLGKTFVEVNLTVIGIRILDVIMIINIVLQLSD